MAVLKSYTNKDLDDLDNPVAADDLRSPSGSWLGSIFETSGLFLVLLIALVAALFYWASITSIDQVVRVEGKIIPMGKSQQLQHLEGGIIASISTREGAVVKANDLLMTIDNTTAGTNLSATNIKLDDQKLRIFRLEAETKGKSNLTFPPELAKLPQAEAEYNLFKARRDKLEHDMSVHQNMINQHNADIEKANLQLSQLHDELATAQQRSALVNNMATRGAASKLEVLDAKSREERTKTEVTEIQGAIPKLKAAVAEEQARIESARAEFQTQAQNELVAAMDESARLKQAVTADADRLKRTEIRAPVDGTINRIYINTVGGVIKPGEVIIELTPTTQGVLIEAHANPRDRGYLRSGLETQIRVSAYDPGEYGVLRGRVTEVSADSMQDAHNTPYYQVNILVDDIPVRFGQRVMVPGMTVVADIVTGQRNVLRYLLSPFTKFTYNAFRDPR